MDLGSFLATMWPWGIGKTCASDMIVYVRTTAYLQSHSMDKDIQSDDIPWYPLALCEDQIHLPLLKMLPALPHHFLFPTYRDRNHKLILQCTGSFLAAIIPVSP